MINTLLSKIFPGEGNVLIKGSEQSYKWKGYLSKVCLLQLVFTPERNFQYNDVPNLCQRFFFKTQIRYDFTQEDHYRQASDLTQFGTSTHLLISCKQAQMQTYTVDMGQHEQISFISMLVLQPSACMQSRCSPSKPLWVGV